MLAGLTLARIRTVAVLLLLPACAPRSAAPPAKRTSGTYHVVRPGENLYRIGKAYDVTHEELARANNLRDPDRIRAGQKLFVPGAARQLPVELITPTSVMTEREAAAPPRDLSIDGALEPIFMWPVSGAVNSPFGPRGAGFHDGIDIAAPAGTPIRAIDAGEVIYSDQLRGYGNMVIIRHSAGFVSVYAHNERNFVIQGQRVSRGETIARVGSTGRVTGPHLHFEIRRNNKAEDPLSHMPRLCCVGPADNLLP
ncbi:MAG TPA: LysM peptidoglycan-binding domain-containing M23 family metallopeptidase [Candidatus Binatia bacterium]|nr:LysM peptidoglycan-binding domain-containing M23 family metallopeptidase [Candidatus Binatia bacterium]